MNMLAIEQWLESRPDIFKSTFQFFLTAGDANKLYAAASWGACFLAAPAGVCFDALGPGWPCAQCR